MRSVSLHKTVGFVTHRLTHNTELLRFTVQRSVPPLPSSTCPCRTAGVLEHTYEHFRDGAILMLGHTVLLGSIWCRELCYDPFGTVEMLQIVPSRSGELIHQVSCRACFPPIERNTLSAPLPPTCASASKSPLITQDYYSLLRLLLIP